ncbi:MAG: phage minor capsid protein [Coriobacteriia bacterium]|nr:phage minor capsid protein [Coriobacteriia bacterium]
MPVVAVDIDELVATILHGAQERYIAELTDTLIKGLVSGVYGDKEELLVDMIASQNRTDLDTVLMRYQPMITDEVMDAVQSTLLAADSRDVSLLARYYGAAAVTPAVAALSTLRARELAYQTARGLAEIINRQNIAMVESAAATWYEVTGNVILGKNAGLVPMKKLIAEGVMRLQEAGITHIDYISGVSNHIDVAIRRHIVSQASQTGGQMTIARLEEYGHELVITSAHYGARPSHAQWQGQPCALHGAKIIDGVEYPSLEAFTGYGTVQGLKGVNCRHSLGPYFPGITELPDLGFPKESEHIGMSSEDYYDATQRQRELERRIRSTKRDIAALEKAELGLESPAYVQKRLLLGRQQGMIADHCRMNNLPRQYVREKAYGVTLQPRALRVAPFFEKPISFVSVGAMKYRDKVLIFNDKLSGKKRFGIIAEGSKITNPKRIAGPGTGGRVDKAKALGKKHKVPSSGWAKYRGDGQVEFEDGTIHDCELHWFWHKQVGRVDMKIANDYTDPFWRV